MMCMIFPLQGKYHPMYEKEGGIPASVRKSNSALPATEAVLEAAISAPLLFTRAGSFRQEAMIPLYEEAVNMTQEHRILRVISMMLAGPTANFRHPVLQKAADKRGVPEQAVPFPYALQESCRQIISDYVLLLRKLRDIPGVKKVFVRSGVRFDYVLADPDKTFLRELCKISCKRTAACGTGACVGSSAYTTWVSLLIRCTCASWKNLIKQINRLQKDQYASTLSSCPPILGVP